jgi:ATP-dependent protease HslVU (ClpYQ) peptidase subunit
MYKPPHQKKGQSDYDFMVTTFIESIKDCFDEGGYSQKYKDGDDKGGTFLVGYKGELYMVESDYQVAMNHDKFISIGCGEDLAEGAMFALACSPDNLSGSDRIKIALSAAAHFSGGVAEPFNLVEMSKKDSELEAAKIKAKTPKKKKKEKKD